jgi:hypothetical protein
MLDTITSLVVCRDIFYHAVEIISKDTKLDTI